MAETTSSSSPARAPVLIGLGANLPSDSFGSPRETLEAALGALERRGVKVVRRSRWYESAPVPPSGQPWYVNGVAAVETALGPEALLAALHEVEHKFGRVRGARNAARVVDLDLIAYGEVVRPGPEAPILPHPRAAERAFVLLPLAEIAPEWRLPGAAVGTGAGRDSTIEALIARLPPGQEVRLLAAGPGPAPR
jgi:2-amino-4-hydroxy-6-hydroxymethyldihydropteridine diphosphokinase